MMMSNPKKEIHPTARGSLPVKSAYKKIIKSPLVLSLALGLVALTFLAYLPAIRGGFIWDDDSYVTSNPTLRSLDGLKAIWFRPGATPQYYPLIHTALWIQYHLWQLNPLGYHIVNVLLHSTSALLLWLLLTRLQVAGAFLAAGIFALHPVHVESVAWITEIKNVMSAVFYLLSVLFYLKFFPLRKEDTPSLMDRFRFYGLSFLFFVCALLSKTVTCSLPAALLIITWWKRGRVRAKEVLALVPFFAAGLAGGLFTAWMEKHNVGAFGEDWHFTLLERCLIAGRAWCFYVGKLFYPYKLIFTYPRWEINTGSFEQYLFPLAALGTLVVLWFLRNRIGRAPLAGVLFFSATLFPALGFFNVYPMRFSFVADHFQYLASLGIIVLFSAGAAGIFQRQGLARPWAAYSLCAVLFCVLAVLTWDQGKIYKNRVVLFSDVIAKNPSSWMGYNNRGAEFVNLRLYDLAFADFNKALALKPDYAEAYNNRGLVYLSQQRYDLALADFNKAIKLLPQFADPYSNRGLLYQLTSKLPEALRDFNKAVRFNPRSAVHYMRRGIVHGMQEEYPLALADFNKALSLNPYLEDGYSNRGFVYLNQKKYDLAIEEYNQAIRLNPSFAMAYKNRSVAYRAMGFYRRSLRDALRAESLGLTGGERYIQELQKIVAGLPKEGAGIEDFDPFF